MIIPEERRKQFQLSLEFQPKISDFRYIRGKKGKREREGWLLDFLTRRHERFKKMRVGFHWTLWCVVIVVMCINDKGGGSCYLLLYWLQRIQKSSNVELHASNKSTPDRSSPICQVPRIENGGICYCSFPWTKSSNTISGLASRNFQPSLNVPEMSWIFIFTFSVSSR